MKTLYWRFAAAFALSLLAVMTAFIASTYTHLQHELRIEQWERAMPGHKDWVLHGSYSEAEIDDIVSELWRLALAYAAPVTALALGFGYYLARRSFQPVAEINRQLQAIGAQSLNQRIVLDHADEEFRAIKRNINSLLDRLDTSFRQLTEFSAQVAHELRTPLTLLRLQIEEAAGRIEPALAESMQEELRRLSDYVDQCLLLATAEQGRLTLNIAPVPLAATVAEMIEIYELLAKAENRALTVSAPAEVVVPADVRTLRQILHNLLTNALRHGTGPIRVTVAREGAESVCRIENEVAAEPVSAGRGPGLGLRIVRAIAALHPQLTFTSTAAEHHYVSELRWK